jgi:alpha-N-arabinofuranosidase
LNGSASVNGKRLVLTVTNPSLDQPREAEIALRRASAAAAKAVVLAAGDVHAHNSFAEPRAVEPRQEPATAQGASLRFRFPPASVVKLEIDLA